MLALTRRRNESIELDWAGTVVTVYVVRIGTDTVRIAIDAPKHIAIVRSELRDRLREVIDNLPAHDGPDVRA
jgi:carbon storage regulator CsrA